MERALRERGVPGESIPADTDKMIPGHSNRFFSFVRRRQD
jgi:hypothetical protein